MPIIEKLDPYNFFIIYKLFREATRSVNGKIVKVSITLPVYSLSQLCVFVETLPSQDLSYLNRDLSKVILLDTHPDHVSSHPENAIVIPKWTGAPGDKGLIAMIPFLECTFLPAPASSNALDSISLFSSHSHRNLQAPGRAAHPPSIRRKRYCHRVCGKGSRGEEQACRGVED
jgi:hypothetical protein